MSYGTTPAASGAGRSKHDGTQLDLDRSVGSDAALRLLVDAVEEYAIFMLAPSGVVATWNRGAARIKGYSAAEIVGRHFSVFYTPDDVAAGKPERELAQALETGSARDEGWRVRRDGSRFWANVVITAVHDDAGGLLGYAKVTRDDTERRRTEEQLRRLELMTERERVANHLLQTVVREILGAGLALSASLQAVTQDAPARQIRGAIDVLDGTLRAIRTFVVDLDTEDQTEL